MNIQLRFFASVREILGVSQESVNVPDQVHNIGQLRIFLCGRGGVWSEALGESRLLRMAYNQVMSGTDTTLTDGCEVAFFPPVTGG